MDRTRGLAQPDLFLDLEAGTHSVTCVRLEWVSTTAEVTVIAGRVTEKVIIY